jgi:transposase InsO family protein
LLTPNTPKDKPFIERFIGSFQRECLDEYTGEMTVKALQKAADEFVNDFKFIRPHGSLNYETPEDFL